MRITQPYLTKNSYYAAAIVAISGKEPDEYIPEPTDEKKYLKINLGLA